MEWWFFLSREDHTAVIVTVNGRGDTVLLAYEEYKRMKARIELLEILAEAENDVKNRRVAPVRETFEDLKGILREGSLSVGCKANQIFL